LFGLLLCWGYSWVFLKLALLDSGPFTFAALRTFVAAVFLLLMLRIMGRSLRPTRIREVLTLGIVQTAIFVGATQFALVHGGVGPTSVLVFTMPFWTLIFARFWLGERINGKQWLAVAFAAIGLLAIIQPWALTGSTISKLLAMFAGMTWAVSTIIAKRIQLRAPIDLVSLTAWQMVFGSLILSTFSYFFVNEGAVDWNPRFLGILGFTAIVSTALGWVIWLYLLKHLSAGVAGMSMLAVPIIAISSAAWHLGEQPAANELVGIGAIVLALLVLSVNALQQRREFASEMTQE
jgi:drug/metabolite transporter (DMT)-like permease